MSPGAGDVGALARQDMGSGNGTPYNGRGCSRNRCLRRATFESAELIPGSWTAGQERLSSRTTGICRMFLVFSS